MTHVGILGGGQLARMLALAGVPLGLRFRFLDPAPGCPAAALGEHVCAAYDDPAAITRFIDGLDVVTYEFENVPVATAHHIAEQVLVRPAPMALEVGQDRLAEKKFLRELGVPIADFLPVGSHAALLAAVEDLGLPAVVKTRRHGYDGRGQAALHAAADINAAWSAIGEVPAILESFVPFRRELSLVVARDANGSLAPYPLVENVHHGGILRTTKAPAPDVSADLQQRADGYAALLLDALGYVGVLAIELFELADGSLVINEFAPRVHNTGHWSIEGAQTSQFANHLRAVVGLPLGATTPLGFACMVNLIGTLPDPGALLALPDTHLHLYGKDPRPGRKLGHVTARAASVARRDELCERIQNLVAHH